MDCWPNSLGEKNRDIFDDLQCGFRTAGVDHQSAGRTSSPESTLLPGGIVSRDSTWVLPHYVCVNPVFLPGECPGSKADHQRGVCLSKRHYADDHSSQ